MDTNDLLTVTTEETSIKNFKAIFYQLTAKPDSTTKVFAKDVTIGIDDIYYLNDNVAEKLRTHYKDAGFIITISVKFTNKKMINLCWEEFESRKWYENETISNITIVWTFNAILPQYEVPQRHTLTVKMSNGMKPEEMLNIIFNGGIEEIEEIDSSIFPIIARVDFIDRILGDELLDIVSKWIKGLKDSPIEKSRIIMFLKKHKGKVATIINYVTYIFILICSILLINGCIFSLEIKNVGEITSKQLISIINVFFCCAGIWFFSKNILNAISQKVYDLLREYGQGQLFNITNGDKNTIEKLKRLERHRKVNIVISIGGTAVLNIICSIIASLIY